MASQSNKIVKKYKGTKGRKHQTKLGRHVVRKKDDDLEDIELLVMDKLKSLMINHNYNDAKVLFLELLRTARFAIPNTWKLGAEILAKTSPERLTEYLKAVHINAPPSLQFKIFNVYIDRLMAEEDWTTAIDEMQLVYTRPLYNKPVVWRKLAISSFRQWSVIHQQKVDRDTLKDEASEDDESMDEDSKQDLEYERLTKATAHRLEIANQAFRTDVEILDMYLKLLDATGDSWGKKHIIVESLKLFEEEDIDLRFVSYMMKINENDRYYSSKPYILFFNEKIPTMEADENFQKYARYTCRRFVTAMENSNTEDQEKFGKRIKHLFSVFIRRLEHYVFDVWLLKELRKSLFEYLLDEETHELYEEKRVYHLLRLNMAKLKAKKKVVAQKLASELETLMENYELHSVRKEPSMDSSLQLFEKIKDHPIFG